MRQLVPNDKRKAKAKIRKKVPAGFFEITKPVVDPKELSGWVDHFRRQRIKTVMVQSGPYYVLCREGVEARGC